MNTWLVKRIGPSELGYNKTHLYRVRHGLVPISDELFRALLKHLMLMSMPG